MQRSWSRKLARRIVVKHGRPGELKTLSDARALIQSLPQRRRSSKRGSTPQSFCSGLRTRARHRTSPT
jgi:hypothetical protein